MADRLGSSGISLKLERIQDALGELVGAVREGPPAPAELDVSAPECARAYAVAAPRPRRRSPAPRAGNCCARSGRSGSRRSHPWGRVAVTLPKVVDHQASPPPVQHDRLADFVRAGRRPRAFVSHPLRARTSKNETR